ncbi:hypothetical protein M422DRAFT_184149 [Sphaerobolus stellatus SS14]|uniref:DRBM domain-containing protein n=1 Tax=Sphaerobolus stellatus (strain SS14) TaxID=990650 RepID=A0A0C9TR66_SPHS4|nr:hypothetical protein M422DRAFT_184149 [Sphaerobolus stellatus SS14]
MTLHNFLQGKGMVGSLSWQDSRVGPDNAPVWTATVHIAGQVYGSATGGTKQLARNAAARKALDVLKRG